MGIPVARLRVGLVAGAVLLTLVVAGFLGYARYRARHFLAGLPGKLGIDIRRETNGYTYSQSVGGKTVMTLHASKAVEHMDGKLTLHDVSMVLYGRKQDRNDRISGSEFVYEPSTGVVRAVGEVHIDLQAPARALPGAPGAAGSSPDHLANHEEEDNSRMIHVKTSGLVYIQKLGVAATDRELEFRIGGMTGRAVGAEYNSDTNILILQSEVKANGLERGTPVVLTASHAELDRSAQRALLTDAMYQSPRQSVRGDHATVGLRTDGSPERVEATGNVVLASPGTGEVSAPRATVALGATGRAEAAQLSGGVRYTETSSLREANGRAEEAHIAFDAAGQPETVLLTGAVRVNDRSRRGSGDAWGTREAMGETMTLHLAGRPATLQAVEAVGAAHTVLVDEAGARSELGADVLRGRFSGVGKGSQLTSLRGEGHTMLVRRAVDGGTQTSSGDMLEVAMRPGAKSEQNIAKATQTGHVSLSSSPAAKAGTKGSGAASRAVAETAVYEGDADRLTLTGGVQMVEESNTVSANRIVVARSTGDALAEGAVRATYLQAGATEPVHVLGERAELEHDAGRAVFYGSARPARLWQGGSQVEAPVLEFERAKGRLLAHDAAGGHAAAPVHAVLVGAAKQQARPSVERIASRALTYSDAARQVDFTDGVTVEGTEGTLRAHHAVAFLQAAAASGAGAVTSKVQPDMSFGSGSVERIVATGKVELDQPGLRAAGEQLVYTAVDRLFVLTGTPDALPRLVDETQGTVVGREIRFHAGDQSVAVIGGDEANPSARVHSVVRARPR